MPARHTGNSWTINLFRLYSNLHLAEETYNLVKAIDLDSL